MMRFMTSVVCGTIAILAAKYLFDAEGVNLYFAFLLGSIQGNTIAIANSK